ncbi:MAG TPA: cysteine synthase CysM [Leptospiraceae bacterium]|nr:cysteine synthase CysM [Leptospiraceae bacterium]HNN57476.1 cysteine synthase CysM [Leptospiraceae bacterium]
MDKAFRLSQLIGNTPLVDLSRKGSRVRLFGKLEGNNPAGSVKDRPALWMMEQAELRGELKPGMRIVEATSGNTGIALAMVAAVKGYGIELIMPEDATRERVLAMQAYGATVTLTDASRSMEGAIDLAHERFAEGGFWMPNQFANPDNWKSHYHTTGPEIWRDTEGRVTHFVSSMGTTGTIMGTSRFLKEKNPAIQIIGVQPEDGAKIPGIRRWPVEYLPAIFEPARVDRVMDVTQQDAEATTRLLAKRDGVFCGMSSGGAICAASRLAEQLEDGVIVTILCDRGDRYLSSDLFG